MGLDEVLHFHDIMRAGQSTRVSRINGGPAQEVTWLLKAREPDPFEVGRTTLR
jgi:hypothetical protein